MRTDTGKLYGLGVGPGDPELLTLKAVRILGECATVFVPRSGKLRESRALHIASAYLRPDAAVEELEFPMSTDGAVLGASWEKAARLVKERLESGRDACFLTLGDISLYSTFHYLLKHLSPMLPHLRVELIPGVTSYSAAAARSLFCLGEGDERLALIPSVGDLESAEDLLDRCETVVLMKIGKNIDRVLDFLEKKGRLDTSILASRVGLPEERIVRDLESLRHGGEEAAYLSVILSRRPDMMRAARGEVLS
jgi:precorrin-2/cobalt-factor-2 C20-methyltransferase